MFALLFSYNVFSLSLFLYLSKKKKILCREKQSSITFFFFFNCHTHNNNNKNNKERSGEDDRSIEEDIFIVCDIILSALFRYTYKLIHSYTIYTYGTKQNYCTHAWTFKCIYSWSGRKGNYFKRWMKNKNQFNNKSISLIGSLVEHQRHCREASALCTYVVKFCIASATSIVAKLFHSLHKNTFIHTKATLSVLSA